MPEYYDQLCVSNAIHFLSHPHINIGGMDHLRTGKEPAIVHPKVPIHCLVVQAPFWWSNNIHSFLPPGHGHPWPPMVSPRLVHESQPRNATGHIFNAQREGRGLFRATRGAVDQQMCPVGQLEPGKWRIQLNSAVGKLGILLFQPGYFGIWAATISNLGIWTPAEVTHSRMIPGMAIFGPIMRRHSKNLMKWWYGI